MLGDRRRNLLRALVHVGDEQDRLCRQRAEVAGGVGGLLGHRHIARRAAPPQSLDDSLQPALLGDRHAVTATGLFGDPLDPSLGRLEVGQDQLCLDRLDVRKRIDPPLGVDDVLIAMGPTT